MIIIWLVLVALILVGAAFFRSYSRRGRAPQGGGVDKRLAAFLAMREFAYADMGLDNLLSLFHGLETPVQGAIQAVKAGEMDRASALLDEIEGPPDVLNQMIRAKILQSMGDTAGAQEVVANLLRPEEESRAKVSAWAVLRDMGQVPGEDEANHILGVVCEFELTGVTALVAGYSDGDARLLTSKGFAMIGVMQQHPDISGAAVELVNSAKPLTQHFEPITSRPLPEVGMIRVSILTPAGTRAAYMDQSEIANPDHALHPLWSAMQDLLTAFRVVGERTGMVSNQQNPPEEET